MAARLPFLYFGKPLPSILKMTPDQISASFREARLASKAVATYPGNEIPKDLDTAYRIQETSISAWADTVSGWKVAVIQPAWREAFPAERLAGPIFSKTVWVAGKEPVQVPVIENGYAAVEAEFAIRISHEIPAATRFNDPVQLLPYIEGVYAAIELAASPLASLSSLGPGAVISDFGNNSGLVVGSKLPMDVLTNPSKISTATQVNEEVVGSGGADRVPGGPLSALLFLVESLGKRGRTLGAGDWVSTGATTGIHQVKAGDRIKVSFGEEHQILAVIFAANGPA
jgi:2-keto-4-pentenoate hydratase